MHAFYCRLLHLHRRHAHDEAATPATEAPEPTPLEPTPQTRPGAATTPTQGRKQRLAIDRDRKPSLHTLLVPRLLESGYTLDQISDLTGIPRALVELIADEHGTAAANIDADEPIRVLVQAKFREAELARRRRTRTVAGIMLLAALNIAASLASVVWHMLALGLVATIGLLLLILAVFVLARRGTPTKTDRPDPLR